MATYHVDFLPSGAAGSAAHVALIDPVTSAANPLPCVASSGTYDVEWALFGNPGASGPGLVEAIDVAGINTVPKLPVGFDPGTGQPIKIVNTFVRRVLTGYVLR